MRIKTVTFTLLSLSLIASIVYASQTLQIPSIPEIELSGEPGGLKPRKTLKPFDSEAELKAYFKSITERQHRAQKGSTANSSSVAASPALTDSAAPMEAKSEDAGKGKDGESVTNNQHAGVDEGGIVKLRGEHLVILRRGRLFTVRVGDDSLAPVSAVDAFAPGVDPRNDWYDEMLISGQTVAVIGYSYGRGGTEVNLFDIDDAGGLAYRSTYHLRSNDYYSSRNYASRLIGNKLIFYAPQYVGYYGDPMERFPAVRKWRTGTTEKDFEAITTPTRIYRAAALDNSSYNTALHTVTVCDLSNRSFDCKATGVLGAPGRVFYVSPESVYVWTTDWSYRQSRAKASSMLYKLPLDGSAPSALGVTGSPIDQFSFLESNDGHLNVLVRSEGSGEQMWGSEVTAGDIALFSTPIDRFSDGTETAPYYRYRELPKSEGYALQNRFVGSYLLYGTGSGWGSAQENKGNDLTVVNWANGDISSLDLDHGVDRIEQMGTNAVIVGARGNDLHFSPVELGEDSRVRKSYVRENAAQGEMRSHGFFYKPTDKGSGLLGLPIARGGRPGYRHIVEGSAAILFLRNDDLNFEELGELGAANTSQNDNCRASCVDWYGNARPLFIRNRVFALLGYEIVEGTVSRNGITEKRRMNYSARRSIRNSAE